MLLEDEGIQIRYNITNIRPKNFYVDTDRFYLRTEEKYGLYELNVDKIDI